jgi:general secretion pathway protein A
MINILCDRALLIAYGDERRRITSCIVIRAMWEVLNRSMVKKLVFVLSGILLFFVALYLVWADKQPLPYSSKIPHPTSVTSSVSTNSTSDKTMSNQSTIKLEQEILSYDQNNTHINVFNTFANCWGVRPLNIFTEGLRVPDNFRSLAAKRNLRITKVNGTLDNMIRYDLPFIVVTKITGKLGAYCYAVTSAVNKQLSISPPLFKNASISREDIAAISSGAYYLVWQNYGQIPDTLTKGEQRFEIRALQRLLKETGFYQDTINGTYTTATITAVRQFQLSQGIAPDESLGELTLAVLTKFDSAHTIPSLKTRGSK